MDRMTPIQLWLPSFFGGIARPELRSDIHRMFTARTTERVIWSVPGWRGASCWMQDGVRVSCLNGEHLECARILHIGEKGAVAGPAAAWFPDLSVAGILDHWLNDDFVRAIEVDRPETLHFKVPHPVEGGVELADAELTVPDEFYLPPTTHIRDERIFSQWPRRPDMPTTVSPEMESARWLSDRRSSSPMFRYAWLAPFDELQPLLVSLDDMYARDKMRLIAGASGDDWATALAQARRETKDWISKGQASVNEAWLQPLLLEETEQNALVAIYARYGGKDDYSLQQVYKNEKLRRRLSAPMAVTRAWGVPGLMWALLLEQLQAAQPYRTCEICGRLNSGKGHKRFCSELDDLACYQARKARDRRRSRKQGASRK
jgi:hypothetical protein